MTMFQKDLFESSGEYITYFAGGERSKVVARFKYQKNGKAPFINCLIKNFTVEEYFSRMEAGEAPLKIAESKGFLLPHIKKLLKSAGYPTTPAGFNQYMNDKSLKMFAR